MAEAPARSADLWLAAHGRRLSLALATTAGFSDAFGYLRLHGILTSHVTGNLAFMAIGIARGNPHILMKFLAVPIFVLWVACASFVITRRGPELFAALRAGILLEIGFLCAGCIAMLAMPPAQTPDDPSAVVLGTLLLGAMGTQNALTRKSLPQLPSTTAMTTNISEATVRWVVGMLDPAQRLAPEQRQARLHAARGVAITVGAFAIGAILGGLAALHAGAVGLLPPIAMLAALLAFVSSGRAEVASLNQQPLPSQETQGN